MVMDVVRDALGHTPAPWITQRIRERMTGGKAWGSDSDIVNYARRLESGVKAMPTNWTKGNPRREAAWGRAKRVAGAEANKLPGDRKYAYLMTVAKNIAAGHEDKRRTRLAAHRRSLKRG